MSLILPGQTIEQTYADLKARIEALEALSEDNLRGEMDTLKKALMENPDACQLMLPEDMGMLVAALRRITGQALATAAEKKAKGRTKKEKAVPLTAEALEQGFADL